MLKPTLLLQNLRLDIADGGGEAALLLTEAAHIRIHLLDVYVDLVGNPLHGCMEGVLRDVGVTTHGGRGAMGLAVAAEEWEAVAVW